MKVSLNSLSKDIVKLESKYKGKLKVNPDLTRTLVSFQASKKTASYRWFKFKEGYSPALVNYCLDKTDVHDGTLLDPFAGSGTSLFAASERGMNSVGIELLPIAEEIIEVRKIIINSDKIALVKTLNKWLKTKPWNEKGASQIKLNSLRITEGAYPKRTETLIESYLHAINYETGDHSRVLRFALLCVLENISYTRKDGQYLRWDKRANRKSGSGNFNKGIIKNFEDAITSKLSEVIEDISGGKEILALFDDSQNRRGKIEILNGSCLDLLKTLKTGSFDAFMTSPPYCNRYDYTRTYALELAALGIGEQGLKNLRQTMMSCTVENKEKENLSKSFSPALYRLAKHAFDNHEILQRILQYLENEKNKDALNNRGIVRMVRNYFFEMSLVIFESARTLKKNAPFIMVNDNVRYAGAEIPVDLILSDFAEQSGMNVDVIWLLPRGKGNSSQQMGAHGRSELRKCVYIWRKL